MRFLSYQQYYGMRANQFQADDVVGVKVVAVIGYANDWTAYCGLTTQSDEEVARSGDKIRREAAEALFPTIAASRCWRD